MNGNCAKPWDGFGFPSGPFLMSRLVPPSYLKVAGWPELSVTDCSRSFSSQTFRRFCQRSRTPALELAKAYDPRPGRLSRSYPEPSPDAYASLLYATPASLIPPSGE